MSSNQIPQKVGSIKKWYRPLCCRYCRECNPLSPWSKLIPRKYELSLFAMHERSITHKKSTSQMNMIRSWSETETSGSESCSSPSRLSGDNNCKESLDEYRLRSLISALSEVTRNTSGSYENRFDCDVRSLTMYRSEMMMNTGQSNIERGTSSVIPHQPLLYDNITQVLNILHNGPMTERVFTHNAPSMILIDDDSKNCISFSESGTIESNHPIYLFQPAKFINPKS